MPDTLEIKVSEVNQQVLDKLAEFSGYPDSQRLVQYLVSSIIDGARRPGSWERQFLYSLGIESNNDCYMNSAEQLLEHYQRELLS
jgi:hypothetical protein